MAAVVAEEVLLAAVVEASAVAVALLTVFEDEVCSSSERRFAILKALLRLTGVTKQVVLEVALAVAAAVEALPVEDEVAAVVLAAVPVA